MSSYSRPLSIVTPFGHNAIFEKMVIIGRCDYRQGKSLMFYYESDTEGRWDYRKCFIWCDYKRRDYRQGLTVINKQYDGNSNADEDLESEDEPPPLLSARQGKEALEVALRYCEEQQSEKVSADFLKTLRVLIRDAALKVQEEKRQMQLDSFFE